MWPLKRAHLSHGAVCICGDVAHWRITRYVMIWKNNEDKKKKTRRQENNKDAGDLRRRRLHYDVIVMPKVTPGINSLISISTTKASICECISSAYSDLVKK